MTRIVFDVGGTWTRVASVKNGVLGAVEKVPTPQNPAEGVPVLASAIAAAALGESLFEVVGGFPGALNTEGVVTSAPNLPEWVGVPFRTTLSETLGVLVCVRNDADLAGLGEACFGAGKGYDTVMYVGLGTGVGGALIMSGEVRSHTKSGFELGHQVVNYETRATLESLVGGAALERAHGMPPRELPETVWEDLLGALSTGLWNGIMLWSPDVVVLGGSLVRGAHGFDLVRTEEAVKKLATLKVEVPVFAAASLADESGLYGASALLISRHEEHTD